MLAKSTYRALLRISSFAELTAYLERNKPKAKKHSGLRPSRAEKRKIHAEETAEIREIVMARGDPSQCECECMDTRKFAFEMDHFYGRGVRQSVENCWRLGLTCHHYKTENFPSRRYWDDRFDAHCERYGYPFRPRLTKDLKGSQPPKAQP